VSSLVSKMAIDRCSEELRNQLKACGTIADVSGFMTKFVTLVVSSVFMLDLCRCIEVID